VAAKHGIHVPSLVADSLVTDEDEAHVPDLDDVTDIVAVERTLAPVGGGR
jgi:hypothetical protein